jgi:hypothetical protein
MSFAKQFRSVFSKVIPHRATVNPGSLADGAGETVSITVPGAALGDTVLCGPGADLLDVVFSASVVAANTVEIRFQNEAGATRDIASSTWNITVLGR